MAIVGGLGGIVSLLGTAVGVIGAIQQGNAAKAAADFNAKIAERDAKIQRQNAGLAAERQREATTRRLATTRANIASSGITPQGSPLDVLEETAALGKQDELNAAAGFLNSADASNLDAQRERIAGKNAKKSAFFNAAGTAFGGIGNVLRLS